MRDVARNNDPQYFEEESFVCVCAETALDAGSPEEFLERVPDFVNDQLWGNLGAGIMIHPKLRRQPGERRADSRIRLSLQLRFRHDRHQSLARDQLRPDVYALGRLSRRNA